jgi:hypothetical protein
MLSSGKTCLYNLLSLRGKESSISRTWNITRAWGIGSSQMWWNIKVCWEAKLRSLEEGKCFLSCPVKLANVFCHIVSVHHSQVCCSLVNETTIRDGSSPSSCTVWKPPMDINFVTILW